MALLTGLLRHDEEMSDSPVVYVTDGPGVPLERPHDASELHP